MGGGAPRCYPQTPLPALLAWLRRRHASPPACTQTASLLPSSPPLHCQQRGRRRPRPLRIVLQVLEHVRRQVLVEPKGRHLVRQEEEARSSSSAKRIPRSVSSKDVEPMTLANCTAECMLHLVYRMYTSLAQRPAARIGLSPADRAAVAPPIPAPAFRCGAPVSRPEDRRVAEAATGGRGSARVLGSRGGRALGVHARAGHVHRRRRADLHR